MRLKLAVIFLAFMFILAGHGRCDELSEARLLFYQGNSLYSEEKFEEAITYYEKVLDLGFESGELYYNLGNAYFKHGLLGKAILNYSRAKRLMPKDADLKSNLDYAQSLIKGGMVISERKWFTRIFFNIADLFSLDRGTLLSVILYFILSLVVILLIILKDFRKMLGYISGGILAFLILSVSIFFTQFNKTIIQKQAVVTSESSDSKFEPLDSATTFFTLNEGESVSVITSRKDWVKVRRLDGKQGWIKSNDIDIL